MSVERRFYLFALSSSIALAALSISAKAGEPADGQLKVWLEKNIPVYMAESRMPGFSIAVVEGAKVYFSSYCFSPAALFNPDVLSRNRTTDLYYTDPFSMNARCVLDLFMDPTSFPGIGTHTAPNAQAISLRGIWRNLCPAMKK